MRYSNKNLIVSKFDLFLVSSNLNIFSTIVTPDDTRVMGEQGGFVVGDINEYDYKCKRPAQRIVCALQLSLNEL
jgi:hypothetical protein